MTERALIAGVGQPWMRDLAFGSHVVRYLTTVSTPEGVDALDLSFSPITACEMIADGRYERIVFVTARAAGRPPRAFYELVPERAPLVAEQVHAHIGDAVMGSVSLETLLVLCRFRSVLPESALIVEVEPEDESWGPELSAGLEALVRPAAELALLRCRRGLS